MPICAICGENEDQVTKCKTCGEKFCVDCGNTNTKLCFYCEEDTVDDNTDDDDEDEEYS